MIQYAPLPMDIPPLSPTWISMGHIPEPLPIICPQLAGVGEEGEIGPHSPIAPCPRHREHSATLVVGL